MWLWTGGETKREWHELAVPNSVSSLCLHGQRSSKEVAGKWHRDSDTRRPAQGLLAWALCALSQEKVCR